MCSKLTQKQHTAWLLSAMMAPLIQAASNCSWPVAAVIGILCLGILEGITWYGVGTGQGRWLGSIQWLWMLLVMSEFLHWTVLCWPENRSYHAVPLVLLVLAALASEKGVDKASRAGGVLYWFLLLLFGAVLLSGIKEVKLENLKPEWSIQTAHLVTVMLIPAMGIGFGNTGKKKRLLLWAVLASAVTAGVLSTELIQTMDAPFYEMSRSLTMLGVGERFESLVAAAMTLGYFVLMSYLLSITANAWEMGKRHRRSVWISASFTALVFLSGMRLNSRLLAVGTIVIWVILPLLQNILKKYEKNY